MFGSGLQRWSVVWYMVFSCLSIVLPALQLALVFLCNRLYPVGCSVLLSQQPPGLGLVLLGLALFVLVLCVCVCVCVPLCSGALWACSGCGWFCVVGLCSVCLCTFDPFRLALACYMGSLQYAKLVDGIY